MGRKIDAVLEELAGGIYDIKITDGDIETQDFFDTALVVSLLSDRRASESEALLSHMRRGWIGNEHTPGFEIGSKLWLFEQSRLTRQIINQAADAAREAVLWMVEDGLAVAVRRVSADFLPPSSPIIGARITVEIERSNSVVENRYFDFWPVTAKPPATIPTIVEPPGPAFTPLGITQSMDVSLNEFQRTTLFSNPVGIANTWSISIWCKTNTDGTLDTLAAFMPSPSTFNGIRIDRRPVGEGWGITLWDSAAGLFKDWRLDELDVNSWVLLTFTWNGSALHFYKNGVNRSGDVTKSTDGAGTMVDGNRATAFGADGLGGASFSGRLHSFAIWNSVLTANEIADLYNGGNGDADLRVDFENYISSGNLVGYYVPALDPTSGVTMGEDWSLVTPERDMDFANNISPADLVSDVPT